MVKYTLDLMCHDSPIRSADLQIYIKLPSVVKQVQDKIDGFPNVFNGMMKFDHRDGTQGCPTHTQNNPLCYSRN